MTTSTTPAGPASSDAELPPASTTPPSGDVTFLFTDIQGSTKLWEQHPRAMAIALARHDEIMRAAIASHNGYVFKTIGDAFCAAFPTASDGLNAALVAQRSLVNEQWGETGPLKVRMALHTGIPQLRDGDYFGQPVNRVARLLATGHGGQVLTSATTRAQLEPGSLEAGGALRDLGQQRLKDLAQLEPVYQLIAPDLQSIFPKLKTPPRPFTGVLLSLATFLVGLIIFRVTTAGTIRLSILNPVAMFDSFKRLVLELSTYQEYFLLGTAGLLLALTAGTGWV